MSYFYEYKFLLDMTTGYTDKLMDLYMGNFPDCEKLPNFDSEVVACLKKTTYGKGFKAESTDATHQLAQFSNIFRRGC